MNLCPVSQGKLPTSTQSQVDNRQPLLILWETTVNFCQVSGDNCQPLPSPSETFVNLCSQPMNSLCDRQLSTSAQYLGDKCQPLLYIWEITINLFPVSKRQVSTSAQSLRDHCQHLFSIWERPMSTCPVFVSPLSTWSISGGDNCQTLPSLSETTVNLPSLWEIFNLFSLITQHSYPVLVNWFFQSGSIQQPSCEIIGNRITTCFKLWWRIIHLGSI